MEWVQYKCGSCGLKEVAIRLPVEKTLDSCKEVTMGGICSLKALWWLGGVAIRSAGEEEGSVAYSLVCVCGEVDSAVRSAISFHNIALKCTGGALVY